MISIKKAIQKLATVKANEPVLLWTNPNPRNNFGAQTINESSTGWVSGKHLSDYDMLEILYAWSTESSVSTNPLKILSEKCVFGEDGMLNAQTISINMGETRFSVRVFSVTDTGIVFQDGFYSNITTKTQNNSYSIPYKIYGIRSNGGGV